MRNIMVLFILGLALTLIVTPAMAAGPWKGKIIDIETKEPLGGAVIVAYWERVYRTPAGDNPSVYKVKEVLTDKDGKFEIPSYTPINLLPIISYMRGPRFTIFKPSYLGLSSVDFGEFFLAGIKETPLERKGIDGKTFLIAPGLIQLPKLKTKEERRMNISSVSPTPDEFLEDQKNLIRLINEEEENLGLQKSDPFKAREFIRRGK